MASSWNNAPFVFIPAITCPNGHRDYFVIKVFPTESDGSKTRRCICRKCSQRFVVVVEESATEWQEPMDT